MYVQGQIERGDPAPRLHDACKISDVIPMFILICTSISTAVGLRCVHVTVYCMPPLSFPRLGNSRHATRSARKLPGERPTKKRVYVASECTWPLCSKLPGCARRQVQRVLAHGARRSHLSTAVGTRCVHVTAYCMSSFSSPRLFNSRHATRSARKLPGERPTTKSTKKCREHPLRFNGPMLRSIMTSWSRNVRSATYFASSLRFQRICQKCSS